MNDSENIYTDVREIIEIRSNKILSGCTMCDENWNDFHSVESKVNHYIRKHNCVLLWIGSESSWNDEVTPRQQWNNTIAILKKR